MLFRSQMDIPVESPEEALAERISLEEVLHALPEQDRQLIRLRFYGNKTPVSYTHLDVYKRQRYHRYGTMFQIIHSSIRM